MKKKFLEEAIQSVLSQTCSNWELFLVDDGSTGGSTRLAKEYAKTFPGKISYLALPRAAVVQVDGTCARFSKEADADQVGNLELQQVLVAAYPHNVSGFLSLQNLRHGFNNVIGAKAVLG